MENCTMIISLLLGALNQSRFVDVDIKKHERWEREQKRSMCAYIIFFLKDFEFSTLNKTIHPDYKGLALL